MPSFIKSALQASLFLHLAAATALHASSEGTSLPSQVPIIYDGVTLRVPVHIFGKTLYFVVDSGSTISGVDTRYISELGGPIEDVQTSGMNTAGSRLSLYLCPESSVADVSTGLSLIAAMDLSVISRISGSQCDGILGMDFLQQHVISLDLDKKIMVVSSDVSEKIKHGALAVSLYSIRSQHVAIDAIINHVRLQMMIDTGDSGSMSLNATDWKQVVGSTNTKIQTVIAGGSSSVPVRMSAARIESMDVLSNHYENLVGTLARNPAAPSTLGIKFLRRHLITFDFPNHVLFLEPSSRFAELESTDMSGLHIVRQGANTVVYAVDEGSPAADAKISAGDIIESINGKAATTLTLWEIRRALKAQDDKVMAIGVKRGPRETIYKFALRTSL